MTRSLLYDNLRLITDQEKDVSFFFLFSNQLLISELLIIPEFFFTHVTPFPTYPGSQTQVWKNHFPFTLNLVFLHEALGPQIFGLTLQSNAKILTIFIF